MDDGALALLRVTESKGYSAGRLTVPGLYGVPTRWTQRDLFLRAWRDTPFPGSTLISWRYQSTPYKLCLSGVNGRHNPARAGTYRRVYTCLGLGKFCSVYLISFGSPQEAPPNAYYSPIQISSEMKWFRISADYSPSSPSNRSAD